MSNLTQSHRETPAIAWPAGGPRAALGAWARHHLWRWPDVQITVDWESGYTALRLGVNQRDLIAVQVDIPWPSADTRGPEHESHKMVFLDGRWVRSSARIPMRLSTVVRTIDTYQPSVLDGLAQVAAVRAARELERGHALINPIMCATDEIEIFGNRLQLPERATSPTQRA